MHFREIPICCPRCRGGLQEESSDDLRCLVCNQHYPIILGIPDLRVSPDPYIGVDADWAKGQKVWSQSDHVDFAGLLHYYYSITDVVPDHHASQYTRGLLAAPARTKAALSTWEETAGPGKKGTFLEIGCGTAPLLLAAAQHYDRVAGVDIAFRWLVVAKKRLQEAGLDIPLICACAEALPFPEETFNCVAADSVVEVLRDQALSLRECNRVMQPGGSIYIATPNRFSIGPDPHTGIWMGSFLPERWTADRVRKQGGIPPVRSLFSFKELRAVLEDAQFEVKKLMLPDISPAQRTHFGFAVQMGINGYHFAKRFPLSRQVLEKIGPLIHAVARKL